jgi:hypothetical protein
MQHDIEITKRMGARFGLFLKITLIYPVSNAIFSEPFQLNFPMQVILLCTSYYEDDVN